MVTDAAVVGTGEIEAPEVYAPVMVRSSRGRAAGIALLAASVVLPVAVARADGAGPAENGSLVFLASIYQSPELQTFLDAAIEELLAADASLRRQNLRASVIDLPADAPPRLVHWQGDSPVYPASVVKFVYLMAAFAWRDQGLLTIDPALDRQLAAMTYHSSNRATQQVVWRLTDTQAGPRLDADAYARFRERRHRVKAWLKDIGIRDLHAVHPTYDGGGDLYGRDLQFLEDRSVEGCLPNQTGEFRNRQAMTTNDTARLLALLARDLALSPESSAEVRERMRRKITRQPYLVQRIAGGTDERADLEVYAKTGTWGPIFADAGIVRRSSGHDVVIAVFLEGQPAYRGPFIARLTRRVVQRLLPEDAAAGSPSAGGS